MPQKLTAQQAIDVAGDCVRQVTGSTRPLNLGEQLLLYGVFTPQQAAAVRHNVVANGVIGVQRFNFSLDPTFLITLGSGNTMGQLVAVIRQNSVPNAPGLLLEAAGGNESEQFAITAMHFAEAAAIFAASSSKKIPKTQTRRRRTSKKRP